MTEFNSRSRKSASSSSGDSEFGSPKSHRFSFLHKICHRKSPSMESEQRQKSSSSQIHSSYFTSPLPSRLASISGIQETIPDAVIASEFAGLHESIINHVRTYYSGERLEKTATRSAIEHATTGLTMPWPEMLKVLEDVDSRFGALALCIGWTILSRSLLLKSGLSNSPGSTFLPPEVVECFQSFSLGKGAVILDAESPEATVNFALLSRWKQISATLMHSTYVKHAFSHFDSRTVNIERALHDLDPLLCTYAMPNDGGHGKGARLAELREVLRKGAGLAFTLFGQPCFWQFDWTSDSMKGDGLSAGGSVAHNISPFDRAATSVNGPMVDTIAPSELVIWPTLSRVMDGEGTKLDINGETHKDCWVFGKKRYLSEFGTT